MPGGPTPAADSVTVEEYCEACKILNLAISRAKDENKKELLQCNAMAEEVRARTVDTL